MDIRGVFEQIGFAIDALGVAVIVVGIVIATVVYLRRLRSAGAAVAFRSSRQSLGKSILLGLELLVAGDIIRTVAVEPTFESLGILAAIILIRTALSWSLEVELEGRWPWRRAEGA